MDAVDNKTKSLAFVVVVVIFDGWRPHEHVIAPEMHALVNTHCDMLYYNKK